jgi:hypothetical protein
MPTNIERAAAYIVSHGYDRSTYECNCQCRDDNAATMEQQEWAAHVAQVLADAGIIPSDDAETYEEYAAEYHGPPTYIGSESDSIEGVRRKAVDGLAAYRSKNIDRLDLLVEELHTREASVIRERDAAQAKLDAVREWHSKDGQHCYADGDPWPCRTVRILDGGGDGNE